MMDINTGKSMQLNDHIQQSLADILFTQIGETVLNRNYGSNVLKSFSKTINMAAPDLGAEIINCLNQYEKRIKVNQVKLLKADNTGQITIEINYNNNQVASVSLNNSNQINLQGV